MQVIASAPNRIDLAGGTLDLYPLALTDDGGITVNLAVNIYSRTTLAVRNSGAVVRSADGGEVVKAGPAGKFELQGALEAVLRAAEAMRPPAPGFELTTANQAPRGSGLGASSALLLSVCAALNLLQVQARSIPELISLANAIETQSLGVPTGLQDYYPAAYGGLNILRFPATGPRREPVQLSGAQTENLTEWLILCDTGQPHTSGPINWAILRAYMDGDPATVRALRGIKAATVDMAAAVRNRDWPAMAECLGREWLARRELAPGVSTPLIEHLLDRARAAGALSGKVCGAGGGGFVVIAAPPKSRREVRMALELAGGRPVPFAIDHRGLQVRVDTVPAAGRPADGGGP
ncbi:MAG: hypothetical protein WD535_01300 [Thermaerobacterales bacterium]